MAHLVLESGEGKGKRFPLGKITGLGRLKSCDIPIKDHKASRTNTKIEQGREGFFLEDLGSSNGTFLNDEKIEKVRLTQGDLVKIGKTVFRFENPASPAPQPSPKQPSPAPKPADPAFPGSLATMETPPSGTPAPAAQEVDKDGLDDDIEEIDLGGDETDFEGPPVRAPRLEAAGDASTPKPRPAYVSRVPLSPPKSGSRRPRTFFFQDISQRSGSFRAVIYIGVIALMGLLAYLAYYLASSAI